MIELLILLLIYIILKPTLHDVIKFFAILLLLLTFTNVIPVENLINNYQDNRSRSNSNEHSTSVGRGLGVSLRRPSLTPKSVEHSSNSRSNLYRKTEPRRYSFDSSDEYFDNSPVYFNADDVFTSYGKHIGSKSKLATDIRSTYDVNSARKYFKYELMDHENRPWWENDNLGQYM